MSMTPAEKRKATIARKEAEAKANIDLDFEIITNSFKYVDSFKAQIAKVKARLADEGCVLKSEEITTFGSLVWICWYEKPVGG